MYNLIWTQNQYNGHLRLAAAFLCLPFEFITVFTLSKMLLRQPYTNAINETMYMSMFQPNDRFKAVGDEFYWNFFYPRSILYIYAGNMKFGTTVVHHQSFWENRSISSEVIILHTSVFFSKIENRQAFFKVIDTRKKRDFSILFSDSEGRKKRLSHGWTTFSWKANWGDMAHQISLK